MRSNTIGASQKTITQAVTDAKKGKTDDGEKPKDKKNIELDDCDNDGDQSSEDEDN